MRKLKLFAALLSVLSLTAVGAILAGCNEPAPCDHEYEWVVETPATCTAEGLEVQKCKKCQEEGETRKLDKTAHEYEWVETLAPTCIAKGSEHQVCKNCQAEGETREKDMVAHTPDLEKGYEIDEDAGTHYYECSVCHTHLEEAAHEYEWQQVDPTCTQAGRKTQVCKVCKAEGDSEELPAVAHTPGTEVLHDATSHWKECTVCHTKLSSASHTWGTEAVYDGNNQHHVTCTYEGCGATKTEDCSAGKSAAYVQDAEQKLHYKLCAVCGEGHAEEAACTDGGKLTSKDAEHHAHVCTVCGLSWDVAEHTKEYVTVKEATCSVAGARAWYCPDCFYPCTSVTSKSEAEAYLKGHTVSTQEATGTTEHTKAPTYGFNTRQHYEWCSVCMRQLSVGNHDTDDEGKCSVCGYDPAASYDFTTEDHGGWCEITKYTGKGGEVKIPETYYGKPVHAIADNAFANSAITSVVIPAQIESLGGKAFYGCTRLTEVTFDDRNGATLTIGTQCFARSGIRSLTVQSEFSFGQSSYCFESCTSLAELTIESGVTLIPKGMFNGCTALQTVEIPDTVTELRGDAFVGCTGLTSVKLPASMPLFCFDAAMASEELGSAHSSSFHNTGLTSVIFPYGAVYLSFNGMQKLEWAVIPVSLMTLPYLGKDGTLANEATKLCFEGPEELWKQVENHAEYDQYAAFYSEEAKAGAWHWNEDKTAPEFYEEGEAASAVGTDVSVRMHTAGDSIARDGNIDYDWIQSSKEYKTERGSVISVEFKFDKAYQWPNFDVYYTPVGKTERHLSVNKAGTFHLNVMKQGTGGHFYRSGNTWLWYDATNAPVGNTYVLTIVLDASGNEMGFGITTKTL